MTQQPQFRAPSQQTVHAVIVWDPGDSGSVWVIDYNGGTLIAAKADDCKPAVGDTVSCRWVGRSAGSPTGTLLITQVVSKATAPEEAP